MTSTNDQALTLLQAAGGGALDGVQGAGLHLAYQPAAAPTVGQAANVAAGAAALADYRRRKSANTLRNHGAALASFGRFLADLAGRGRAATAGAGLDLAGLDAAAAAWADLDGAALATSAAA